MIFFFLNGFVDKNAAILNFNLVNQQSLDKILKAEVFVHTNDQLKVAYLILDDIPISKSFQAPRCVIKARDPHLHRISVAAPGFFTTGPIPEGTLTIVPKPAGIAKVALPSQRSVEEEATSSQPSTKGEEGIVEVLERGRKGLLKSWTLKNLKTTLKSSTSLHPLNLHWLTSTIPFLSKQAKLKEAPPHQKTWGYSASQCRPS